YHQIFVIIYFFFQAEDGIRDFHVTGVQTCALPIYRRPPPGYVPGRTVMRWEELDQQPCSLARTLAVVGDRWTLLVLRDCFLGIRRFDEFEKRLGITRHVLADRLKKLVDHGVLIRVPYQQRPLREEYRLTERGLALHG